MDEITFTAAAEQLGKLTSELGGVNLERTHKLIELCQQHAENNDQPLLAEDLYSVLFPGSEPDKAKDSLRQYRKVLKLTAQEKGISLELTSNASKALKAKRPFHFEGASERTAALESFVTESAKDRNADKIVSSSGKLLNIGRKRVVKFFISYARKDRTLANNLIDELTTHLKIDKDYHIELWQDVSNLELGENFDKQIKQALTETDFGLLLCSPNFFGSEYITNVELPTFIYDENETASDSVAQQRAIPVGLKPFDFASQETFGVSKVQIYRYEDKFFSELRGLRDAYSRELYQKIRKLLDKYVDSVDIKTASQDNSQHQTLAPVDQESRDEALKQFSHKAALGVGEQHLERSAKGVPTTLTEINSSRTSIRNHSGSSTTSRVDGMDMAEVSEKEAVEVQLDMQKWLKADGQPFYALLGDLGMGKTVNCRLFSRTVNAQSIANKTTDKIAIYLDLRLYTERELQPTLINILTVICQKNNPTTQTSVVKAEDIIRKVRDQNAVVVFDGLDEILMHYDDIQSSEIVRELWSILPTDDKGMPLGKMVMSCRTHYFPSVSELQSLFNGNSRENVKAVDYRGVLLSPWTSKQIQNYLDNNLPNNERAWSLICEMHDLKSLARQPYSLSLLAGHIESLERKQLKGRTLRSVDLYEDIVQQWLKRDKEKTKLRDQHKLSLMGKLAWELWQQGGRGWKFEKLDGWLVEQLSAHREWMKYYVSVIQSSTSDLSQAMLGKTLNDQFTNDLRTASFIVRPQDDAFRFAHTSMQEYFIACHLYERLAAGDLSILQGKFSIETWHFYGELCQQAIEFEGDRGLELQENAFAEVAKCYQQGISETGFRLALFLKQQGYVNVSLMGWQLAGADLSRLEIGAPDQSDNAGISWFLEDCDFSATTLDHSRFDHVVIKGCRFDRANLFHAEFHHCYAQNLSFAAANMVAAVFRAGEPYAWQDCDFTSAEIKDAQWISLTKAGAQEEAVPVYENCHWQLSSGKRVTASVEMAVEIDSEQSQQLIAEHREKKIFSPAHSPLLLLNQLPSESTYQVFNQLGHKYSVNHVAISPKGDTIVSAADDNSLIIWDADSGKLRHQLNGHKYSVNHVAISPKGDTIVSASLDNSLIIWDATSGKLRHQLNGHKSSVRHVAISPKGDTIVSASLDNSLIIWDATSGKLRHQLNGHKDLVNHVAISPKGDTIVSASRDNSLIIWDATSGKLRHQLNGHKDSVNHVAISPKGDTIVSASRDNSLIIWDATSGKLRHQLNGHKDSVRHVAISPKGDTIVSASRDNSLIIWDATSGKLRHQLNGHKYSVNHVAISPKGDTIVSAADDNSLIIWDADSGKLRHQLNGHKYSVNHVAISPKGDTIVSASLDNSLIIWDATSGKLRHQLNGHKDSVNHVAISPKGDTIVSASLDNSLIIWDATSGKLRHQLNGHKSSVRHVAISPKGDTIVSASLDNSLIIWDATSGKLRHQLNGHKYSVRHVAISPKGDTIVSASTDESLIIWDATSGKLRHQLNGHKNSVNHVAISPKGDTIVSASLDNSLIIWDATSGKLRHQLNGHKSSVRHVAISPKGDTIVSASFDNSLIIWDATSGKLRHQLNGHKNSVNHVAISPKGDTIVSASLDNSLIIWDADSGKLRHQLTAVYDVVSIVFVDDQTLMVADSTGWVKSYSLVLNDVELAAANQDQPVILSAAQKRLPRQMLLVGSRALTIDAEKNEVLSGCEDSWRYVSWVRDVDDDGKLIPIAERSVLPLEVFGAIPDID